MRHYLMWRRWSPGDDKSSPHVGGAGITAPGAAGVIIQGRVL